MMHSVEHLSKDSQAQLFTNPVKYHFNETKISDEILYVTNKSNESDCHQIKFVFLFFFSRI